MSVEQNKSIVRRWVEAGWNQGKLEVFDELYAPGYTIHDSTSPTPLTGAAPFKQFVQTFRNAFPDFHMTIEDIVAEGDKVCWRWSVKATHGGELMGIAPTGKRIYVRGTVVSRFENGKWAEDNNDWNYTTMFEQIGQFPQPVKQ